MYVVVLLLQLFTIEYSWMLVELFLFYYLSIPIWPNMLNVETALGVLLISQIQGHLLLLMSFATSSSCLKDRVVSGPHLKKWYLKIWKFRKRMMVCYFTSGVRLTFLHNSRPPLKEIRKCILKVLFKLYG